MRVLQPLLVLLIYCLYTGFFVFSGAVTVTVVKHPRHADSGNPSSAPFYHPLLGGSRPSRNAMKPHGRCPKRCACSHTTVICSGQDLIEVPRGLPQDTIRLELQANSISRLSAKDFAGLRSLKILQLDDNQIDRIEEGTFLDLANLERLLLNRNHLRAIPKHLFRSNLKLRRLDLSENYLSSIGDEHLTGPVDLLSLQLDRNRLSCMDTRRISSWGRLEVLTLNSNSLSSIGELGPFPSMRILRLGENPWLCDCRLKWMKELKATFLGGVKCHRPALLQDNPMENVDIQRLKCSGIEKRGTSSCRGRVECPTPCTCTSNPGTGITVDCRDRGLTAIPSDLPALTRELRLEQNHITSVPREAFNGLANLARLDLSKNKIHEIDRDAFVGLLSLNTLMLFGNNLTTLPKEVFAPLREQLQLLLLNTNKIRCLPRELFGGMKKLALLSLYDNQIRSIPDGTFDFSTLEIIHLAKNPLSCDCRLAWLETALQAHQIETSGAKCMSPRRIARQRLGSIGTHKFRCTRSSTLVDRCSSGCMKERNLCLNNGTCHMTKGGADGGVSRYECHCTGGFIGPRCEVNLDACQPTNKCQNGGVCLNGGSSYSCKCLAGYSGSFCETITPYAMALVNASLEASTQAPAAAVACSPDSCKHGHCTGVSRQRNEIVLRDDARDATCQCVHGYGGTRCNRQTSVGFRDPGSYLSLTLWPVSSQQKNLSFVLRTVKKSGILAYHGDKHYYVAAELSDGSVKVTSQVGNHPPSQLYSPSIVSDGRRHRIQLTIAGNELSLQLDNRARRRISNARNEGIFDVDEKGPQPLYLGGLPRSLARRALIESRIKQSGSFEGCLSDIRLNGLAVAIDSPDVEKRNTLIGCAASMDLCAGIRCAHDGECRLNNSSTAGYQCVCSMATAEQQCTELDEGEPSSPSPTTASPKCAKVRSTEYLENSDCRSAVPVKTVTCQGACDLDDEKQHRKPGVPCCTVAGKKRRRIKMHCKDGRTMISLVDIPRRCVCRRDTLSCKLDTHPPPPNEL